MRCNRARVKGFLATQLLLRGFGRNDEKNKHVSHLQYHAAPGGWTMAGGESLLKGVSGVFYHSSNTPKHFHTIKN